MQKQIQALSKTCTKCKIDKPVSRFYLRNKLTGSLQSHCIDCRRAYTIGREDYLERARRYRARPEQKRKATNRHYLRKFGIILDEVLELIKLQDNKCYFCKVEFDNSFYTNSNAPTLDHNHKAGEIRRILCQKCNKTLGFIEKAKQDGLLYKMLEYSQG